MKVLKAAILSTKIVMCRRSANGLVKSKQMNDSEHRTDGYGKRISSTTVNAKLCLINSTKRENRSVPHAF